MLKRIEEILNSAINADTQAPFSFDSIQEESGRIAAVLTLNYPAQTRFAEIRAQLESALKAEFPQVFFELEIRTKIIAHKVQMHLKPLAGIKNIIAVASGKGGVGKSTTAVNLALALVKEGAAVGLLDADLYGPSQPTMLGLPQTPPRVLPNEKMQPPTNYGLKVMSIGFLIQTDDTPMIWRGPMVSSTLEQILNQTEWGELDYLIVDLPPGTGDAQLTLAQKIPVAGAVIVTTPQDIALIDAQKGLKMFEKVNVPILGVVENMSYFLCPNCQSKHEIFGAGGAEKLHKSYGVEILGQLPLSIDIRQMADGGKPSVVAAPNSVEAKIYQHIARRTAIKTAQLPRDYASKLPKIVLEK